MFEIDKLACGYGNRVVVEVPALSIADDEVIAVVGRSGGGKSTILATLAGAVPPLAGEIRIDGEIASPRRLRLLVARTLQSFPLLHWLTVSQNLELAARSRGVRLDSAEGVLSSFAAAHLAQRYPKELSGGERARASLAQATLCEPRMLLLDEPLTGLDPVVRNEVAAALFNFAKTRCCSVMLVTHDLEDAVKFADRIVALRPIRGESVLDFDVPTTAPDATERALRALRGNGEDGETE